MLRRRGLRVIISFQGYACFFAAVDPPPVGGIGSSGIQSYLDHGLATSDVLGSV